MRKLFLLSFVFFPVWMFAQGSYYDESKHYQFRSMENGPWQFKPDFTITLDKEKKFGLLK